jgi:hypothetical protein
VGGVSVRVLSIAHKVRGFKLDRGDGILRVIKITEARLSSEGK